MTHAELYESLDLTPGILEVETAKKIFFQELSRRQENMLLPESHRFHISLEEAVTGAASRVWQSARKYQRDKGGEEPHNSTEYGTRVFRNAQFGRIRTLTIGDEPWFVGKDVAVALGYRDTKSALQDHVDAEDRRLIQRWQNATFEIPSRGMTIINESGLYSLILSSKLPGAKAFKRWVTSEVLPAIRKTGTYSAPSTPPKASAVPEEVTPYKAALESVLEFSDGRHLLTAAEVGRFTGLTDYRTIKGRYPFDGKYISAETFALKLVEKS